MQQHAGTTLQRNLGSAMVVLSGGQDSTTCLLWAKANFAVVHAVCFDYGQRHSIEIESARRIAWVLQADSFEVIRVPGVLLSRSPLTDPSAALETYTDHASMEHIIGERIELTFVPLRNPFFLIVAANHALQQGCFTLVTGVCASDNANYPDCTIEFVEQCEAMINQALGFDEELVFQIKSPLIDFTKAETVNLALSYPDGREAMSLTHTCYAGTFPPCGVCHACVLRAEGFRAANEVDPLIERAQQELAHG